MRIDGNTYSPIRARNKLRAKNIRQTVIERFDLHPGKRIHMQLLEHGAGDKRPKIINKTLTVEGLYPHIIHMRDEHGLSVSPGYASFLEMVGVIGSDYGLSIRG